MTWKSIKLNVEDNIAVVTLSRPDKMNALTAEMIHEFVDVLDRCDSDDDVKAVIVTGDGRAFCAGADISGGSESFADVSNDDARNPDGSVNYSSEAVRDGGGFITLRLYDMKKPVIGAVNGAAVGAGSTMLLPMDYRIASETAKFGFVFARRGIVPESASTFFLPRLVGISQALDWCMTGRVFGSQEALDGGLISKICSPETLLECAHTIARNIIDNTSPVSIALTRQMLWKSLGWDHPMDAHKLESRGVFSRSTSADAQEGVASFLEKRPAKYPQSVAKDMPDFYPWWEPENYD